MAKNLISRAEMSRRAGVSPTAVSKACKHSLASACVGKRVDADHPAAVEYLKNKAPAPTPKRVVTGTASGNLTKKTDRSDQGADPNGPLDVPEDIQEFADWSLRQLMVKFGTDTYFVDWLKATKSLEDIQEKRLKNAEKSGELISRDVVKVGIIDTLDGAFTRMLTDGAKTISVRLAAQVKAGADMVTLEDLVAKQLATFIRPTKSKIARVLKNA